MNTIVNHPFDLVAESDVELDLIAEELPTGVQPLSDCLSTASSFSCAGSSSLASFATVNSIWSCG
jgi:hypothetical protein